MKRNLSSLRTLIVIVLPFLAFLLGWNVAVNNPEFSQKYLLNANTQTKKIEDLNVVKNEAKQKDYKIEKYNLDIVDEVYDLIQDNYVDENTLTDSKVKYGLASGLVGALDDPYSLFMNPQENKDFQDSLEGKLEGIGAELTMREKLLTVVSPLKDSPASKAGLMPEDVILQINGETTEDMTLEKAVMKIRGPKGTEVDLKILRKEEGEKDLKIKRDTITIDSVTWEMKENKIALISLNQFGEHTTQEFNHAVNQILLNEAKGLILDLRFNGGGFLDGAVDIVSNFIKKGEVVKIKKRNGSDMEILEVSGDVKIETMPLVVLINKGSASASEIVAGAIQDHKRGLILGEQSFGKGTVQEVVPLIDGSSLRLTIARWFTPNNQNISDKGITPDQLVERTIQDFLDGKDPQFDAAMEYLKTRIK